MCKEYTDVKSLNIWRRSVAYKNVRFHIGVLVMKFHASNTFINSFQFEDSESLASFWSVNKSVSVGVG